MDDARGVGKLQRFYMPEQEISEEHKWLGDHLAAARTGELLDRRDFHPIRFRPDIIPQLIKWDPIYEDGSLSDFRHRVFGQSLVDLFGFDMTGKNLCALPFEVCQKYMFQLGELCIRMKKPVYSQTKLVFGGGMIVHTDKCFYPVFQADQVTVLILFVIKNHSFDFQSLIKGGEPLHATDKYYVLNDIGDWSSLKAADYYAGYSNKYVDVERLNKGDFTLPLSACAA